MVTNYVIIEAWLSVSGPVYTRGPIRFSSAGPRFSVLIEEYGFIHFKFYSNPVLNVVRHHFE